MLKPPAATQKPHATRSQAQHCHGSAAATHSSSSGDTKKRKDKVVYYLGLTKYSIVSKVCASLPNWVQCLDENDDWDLCWTDSAVSPERFSRMKPYQKINHFVGTSAISRKNYLARNMLRMKAYYPNEYKFFPHTWSLPADLAVFRSQFTGKRRKTFIIKPDASSQGRGIFLTRNVEDINPTEHLVAQRYIHKPFLIDGLKFDLRMYVLLSGCSPLRIFVHQDGLVRFATKAYAKPTTRNLGDKTMHLTNYAINKSSSNFEQNCDPGNPSMGHKRSMFHVLDRLRKEGHDVDSLCKTIDECVCKTIIGIQPSLAHIYGSCKGEDLSNSMCFEILGIDIMIDHKLTPWLIEVNHSPSFATDSELDSLVKFRVIRDALVLLGVSPEARRRYHAQQRLLAEQRRFSHCNQQTRDQRMQERQQTMADLAKRRTAWEDTHLGGWRRIYPTEERSRRYSHLLEAAQEIWQCMTGMCKTKVILPRILEERKKASQKSDDGGACNTAEKNNATAAKSAALRVSKSSEQVTKKPPAAAALKPKMGRRSTSTTVISRRSAFGSPACRRTSSTASSRSAFSSSTASASEFTRSTRTGLAAINRFASSTSTVSTVCSISAETTHAPAGTNVTQGVQESSVNAVALPKGGARKKANGLDAGLRVAADAAYTAASERTEEKLPILDENSSSGAREARQTSGHSGPDNTATEPRCILGSSHDTLVQAGGTVAVSAGEKNLPSQSFPKPPEKGGLEGKTGQFSRSREGSGHAAGTTPVRTASISTVEKRCSGKPPKEAHSPEQRIFPKKVVSGSSVPPREDHTFRLKVVDASSLCTLPTETAKR